MKLRARRGLVLVIGLALTSGCVTTTSPEAADDPPATTAPGIASPQVEGVLVAVEGNLAGIESFSLLLGDGSTIALTPGPGLLFDGGPLTHLRDHLVSGSPITVRYQKEDDKLIAFEIGDAE